MKRENWREADSLWERREVERKSEIVIEKIISSLAAAKLAALKRKCEKATSPRSLTSSAMAEELQPMSAMSAGGVANGGEESLAYHRREGAAEGGLA